MSVLGPRKKAVAGLRADRAPDNPKERMSWLAMEETEQAIAERGCTDETSNAR